MRTASLIGVLALCCTQLVVFALLDQRAPVGHEPYYITETLAPLRALAWNDGVLWKLRITTEYFLLGNGAGRPPLAQTALLATLGTFGTSLETLRLANLPFLLMMLVGVYFGARTALEHRASLLAVFVVATLPAIVFFSRTWVVQFHAACLTSVALALALTLLSVRLRREWILWIAFGLVQGLRFYTNPVVLPDIAILFVALALWRLLPGLGDIPPRRSTMAGLGISSLIALAVGAWYLGMLSPWIGEPVYSLPRYWASYGQMAATGKGLDPMQFELLFTIGEIWRDLLGLYWMPGYLLLLLLPGLICTPVALLVGYRADGGRPALRVLGYLALVMVLEFPLALSNIGTGNGTLNWIGLAVPTALMCLVALDVLHRSIAWNIPRQLVWVFAALLLMTGSAQTALPLVRSAVGPDPDSEPDAYEGGFYRYFACTEYCARSDAFHLVSTATPPATTIARGMLGTASGNRVDATFALWNLVTDGGASTDDAENDGASSCAWRWQEMSRDVNQGMEWLFVAAGFRSLETLFVSSPDSARYHVVRLFRRSAESAPDRACESSSSVPPSCLQGAQDVALRTLGTSHGSVTLLQDPSRSFGLKTACDICKPAVARCAASEVRPGPVYLDAVLLIDRGASVTPADDRSGSSPTRR